MGIRTPGLLIANETLYQLSYTPRSTAAGLLIILRRTEWDYASSRMRGKSKSPKSVPGQGRGCCQSDSRV